MSASTIPIEFAPAFDAHTHEVLAAELGLDEAVLKALAAVQITG